MTHKLKLLSLSVSLSLAAIQWPSAPAAATAATPLKAKLPESKTHSTHNPGIQARPDSGTLAGGSLCAFCCGKDGLLQGLRTLTPIGTSGKPWIHLRNTDPSRTTSITDGLENQL